MKVAATYQCLVQGTKNTQTVEADPVKKFSILNQETILISTLPHNCIFIHDRRPSA